MQRNKYEIVKNITLKILSAIKKSLKLLIVLSIFFGVILIPKYMSVETLALILSIGLIIFAAVAVFDLITEYDEKKHRKK